MVTVKVTVKIAYFQVKSLLVSMGTIIYRKITFYKIRVEITTEKIIESIVPIDTKLPLKGEKNETDYTV